MKKIYSMMGMMCAALMAAATPTVTVTPAGSTCTLTVGNVTLADVPVERQGDVSLAAASRDGVDVLVRYTTADAFVADGRVDGEAFHVATDAAAAFAATLQLPNGDFETWGASNGEPRHWHGFKSATGSLAGLAKGTLGVSTDVRPGSTGSKSAVITSGSVFGIVNNGTMTNGQLQAASATAASTDNHSHMDRDMTATDAYGDPYYTALAAAPDAISAWIKFTQGKANTSFPYATISAVVFDGTYYQDPEDDTYTNVAAKACNSTIATGGWRQITMPFDYDTYAANAVEAQAILVTVSTNAAAGKGSSGDNVWVDDMALIYNGGVVDIVIDGLALDGFAFDPATTHYSLTYSGDPMTITADDFAILTDGRATLATVTVEDLGGGNYTVALGSCSADLQTGTLYTIAITRVDDALTLEGVSFTEQNHYATYYGDRDLLPDGDVTVLAVTAVTAGVAVVKPLEAIPSATGVLLYSTTPADRMTATEFNGTLPTTESLLQGSTDGLTINADGYVLEANTFVPAAATALDPHRCWLPLATGADAPLRLIIVRDGTLSVSDVNDTINAILAGSSSADNDYTGDGFVDITDVNVVVNLILGAK